ncbi:MAG: trypsin-like peptidase domain-containing protein [Lachnospiraceae bacterium]|nr:trypsin-like peptidase domain-containing protein [Lachnospiraceae bacterium]
MDNEFGSFEMDENRNDNNSVNSIESIIDAETVQETEQPKQNEKVKETKVAKEKKVKTKKEHGFAFKAMTSAACALIFGVVAAGTVYFSGKTFDIFKSKTSDIRVSTTSTTNTKKSGATAVETSLNQTEESQVVATDVSQVVDNVMPSIVAITSKQLVQSGYGDYFGFGNNDSKQEQVGAGSGIIIGQNDSELLIVTNNHVVEGADSLEIQFIDDQTVDAQIKGTDSSKDLAVVAVKLSDIKEATLNSIKIATLGDSDSLKVGESTIAIGNALGYGQSVTTGVVSALNREFTYEDRTMTLIQTDAAINPGNSGGALLNVNGEVIGINAAKYSSDTIEGMGFAIPVSGVKDVIEDLMNETTKTKVDADKQGYLNIYGRDVTEELAQAYDAPQGVLVAELIEGGAAEKAGIEKRDIITKIDGESVSSMEELQSKLQYYEEGTDVKITVQRIDGNKYAEKEITVTLAGQKK